MSRRPTVHRLSVRMMDLYWLPVLVWCAVIFYMSGVPHLRITEAWWDIIVRKIAHLGEYAILARLVSRALVGTTFWPWGRIFIFSIVLSAAYAATDEYHQTFTAGRVGCFHDVAIDTAGAWAGMGFIP